MADDQPNDVQNLVDQAMAQAKASIDNLRQEADQAAGAATPSPLAVPDLAVAADVPAAGAGIELLGDVEMQVSVELGRTRMLVEDVLNLATGSVVELDKLAGDPVDVYVNHRLVARGEVLVLNDNFCIRVSEIVADLEQEAQMAAQQHHADAAT